jgi:hypothetical protein
MGSLGQTCMFCRLLPTLFACHLILYFGGKTIQLAWIAWVRLYGDERGYTSTFKLPSAARVPEQTKSPSATVFDESSSDTATIDPEAMSGVT